MVDDLTAAIAFFAAAARALGAAAEFPQDRAGIEALIRRLAAGRPSEPRHFSSGDGVALPRYGGEYTSWLSPAGDGALRVRLEHPWISDPPEARVLRITAGGTTVELDLHL